jgi:ribosome-binding protein aMBF1 (putative translation factor)
VEIFVKTLFSLILPPVQIEPFIERYIKTSMASSKSSTHKTKAAWEDIWLELGEYIKERRTALNLSQVDLATKVGFSAQFLGRIEGGKSPLPDVAFKKIISVLKLDHKRVEKIYINGNKNYVTALFKSQR